MSGGLDELQELCDAFIEGRATPDQIGALERAVLADPQMRRFYVEYLHQHASLSWSTAESLAFDRGADTGIRPEPVVGTIPKMRSRWPRRLGYGLAAAAGLMLLVGVSPWGRREAPAPTVATLVGAKGCKWESGSLPTEVGTKLPAGRLRLAEGLARIAFADGAEVSLEAPADIDLVSPKRCVVRSGRLLAKVPRQAIGFTVDTPTARIKDLGTEFGVNVLEGKSADVQVFDGRVDVLHRSTGRVEPMREGANLRFGAAGFAEFDPLAERPSTARSSSPSTGVLPRLVQISTATGRGKDAFIRPPIRMNPGPYALLLVKNTVQDDYSRKAYLGLDLSPVSGTLVVDAQLSLSFAPTGMGYASEVPDATFAVYGLTDESLDDWDESTVRWENAPANQPGGARLDPNRVTLLGRFEIAQGMLSGVREISGSALVDFLNRDTNGVATLILVRETKGSGRFDLVHGFAGKHHPELAPPTLKLTVVPR